MDSELVPPTTSSWTRLGKKQGGSRADIGFGGVYELDAPSEYKTISGKPVSLQKGQLCLVKGVPNTVIDGKTDTEIVNDHRCEGLADLMSELVAAEIFQKYFEKPVEGGQLNATHVEFNSQVNKNVGPTMVVMPETECSRMWQSNRTHIASIYFGHEEAEGIDEDPPREAARNLNNRTNGPNNKVEWVEMQKILREKEAETGCMAAFNRCAGGLARLLTCGYMGPNGKYKFPRLKTFEEGEHKVNGFLDYRNELIHFHKHRDARKALRGAMLRKFNTHLWRIDKIGPMLLISLLVGDPDLNANNYGFIRKGQNPPSIRRIDLGWAFANTGFAMTFATDDMINDWVKHKPWNHMQDFAENWHHFAMLFFPDERDYKATLERLIEVVEDVIKIESDLCKGLIKYFGKSSFRAWNIHRMNFKDNGLEKNIDEYATKVVDDLRMKLLKRLQKAQRYDVRKSYQEQKRDEDFEECWGINERCTTKIEFEERWGMDSEKRTSLTGSSAMPGTRTGFKKATPAFAKRDSFRGMRAVRRASEAASDLNS